MISDKEKTFLGSLFEGLKETDFNRTKVRVKVFDKNDLYL